VGILNLPDGSASPLAMIERLGKKLHTTIQSEAPDATEWIEWAKEIERIAHQLFAQYKQQVTNLHTSAQKEVA